MKRIRSSFLRKLDVWLGSALDVWLSSILDIWVGSECVSGASDDCENKSYVPGKLCLFW